MLGQHPQMYGTPELNLFMHETLGGLHQRLKRTNRLYTLHGLVRTLADIHDGNQTEEAAERAWTWVEAHADWSTDQTFRYICEQVAPRILVDKSPSTSGRPGHLLRLFRTSPDVRILHLSRHPRAVGKSLFRVKTAKAAFGRANSSELADPKLIEGHWVKLQNYIMAFTEQLAPGQSMRLKGELLVETPEVYLRQICQWLGIQDDDEVISAMMRPEDNPFARLGPRNARYGNNSDFLRNPKLRVGRPSDESLQDHLPWLMGENRFQMDTIHLAQQLGYR